MKKPSPLVQMTVALTGLCSALVLLANLFFGVLPDRQAETMKLHKAIAEALAVQVAAQLQQGDSMVLQRTLEGVVARSQQLRSLAVRRADGSILSQAGDHALAWRAGGDATAGQFNISLHADGARWGQFEMVFTSDARHPLLVFVQQPLVVLLLFITAVGSLAFSLYLRRALQHLDPAAVIPERVQGAFDVMAEGVVVMDARGRVMLTNKAFRDMQPAGTVVSMGQALSALPWLAPNLDSDVAAHPWARVMTLRQPNHGHTVEVITGSVEPHASGDAVLATGPPRERRLVINCAPISDPGGRVRGCIATFSDVSELHQANQALHRLATRDPLTGCLNRRAFLEAFEGLCSAAQRQHGMLSCVMVDIDHFKSVNDNHGHPIGDRVIQEVAQRLLQCARDADLVCRYGGEEFCMVLPGAALEGAMALAERVRACIERECGAAVQEVAGMRVTVSLGVQSFSALCASPATMIDHADQALYRAKRAGRNRVEGMVAAAAEDAALVSA